MASQVEETDYLYVPFAAKKLGTSSFYQKSLSDELSTSLLVIQSFFVSRSIVRILSDKMSHNLFHWKLTDFVTEKN